MSTLPIHSKNAAPSLDGSAVIENDVKNQGKLDLVKRITHLISVAIIGGSIATIVLELWSMYLEDQNVIYAAGIIGCVLAPSVIAKQWILSRTETLRCAHNKIRMEINRFMEENNALHLNVDQLEVQVQRVQQAEMELSKITKGCTDNTDELTRIVRDNERLVKRQSELAHEEFQQQIVTTLLKSDRDGDMKVTAREVNVLIARFKGNRGLQFDADKLRTSIENSDGSIKSIMDLLRDINIGTKTED